MGGNIMFFYSGIITKLTELFMSLVALIFSLFPAAPVKANPMPARAEGTDIRVVSFNLRCTGVGTTSVEYREPLMIAQLEECGADSMGFQEANLEWLLYLKEDLENYSYVGVPRTDGDVLGEASPIFYRSDKYDAVESGTFWLSKTPDKVGSRDWASAYPRVCTWVLLENKETKERYVHLNTHLDHISEKARTEQIKVVLSKVNEFIDEYPVVLTGDFNGTVGTDMYNEAVSVLNDSRVTAPVTSDKFTYHNYGTAQELIDFIFVSDKVTPLVYHVIDDKINNAYLSDHYGLYADLKLN